MKRLMHAFFTVCFLFQINLAQTVTVTTTANSGVGSLRQAILDVNAGLTDTIQFNIGGIAPHVITPSPDLPAIVKPVTILGYSQPDSSVNTLPVSTRATNAIPTIVINGNDLAGSIGLLLAPGSEGSEISGLVINEFFTAGIRITNAGNNTITGCFIGTDRTGQMIARNGSGILATASNGNTIGGPTSADRNLIAGAIFTFSNAAIRLSSNCNNTLITGNLIGVNRDATQALGETGFGITLRNNSNSSIVSDNVISGCTYAGIFIARSSDTVVVGNCIGTNGDGDAALPNGTGIIIIGGGRAPLINSNNTRIGGNTTQERNIISGNNFNGIQVATTSSFVPGVLDTKIVGNYIGVAIDGKIALGNGADGILNAAERTVILNNVISSNGKHGLEISQGANNTIATANLIGTDAFDKRCRGNAQDGIHVGKVQGTADNTFIGGPTKSDRNVIAHNRGNGVKIEVLSNNTTLDHNKIFDNKKNGVHVQLSSENLIENNCITENGRFGVFIDSLCKDTCEQRVNITSIPCFNCTLDGQPDPRIIGTENLEIQHAAVSNEIANNSIFDNCKRGIALGLNRKENDKKDPDCGPNRLQNHPILTSAVRKGCKLVVTGKLCSVPNTTFVIELFGNNKNCNEKGITEGRIPLDTFSVTTRNDGCICFEYVVKKDCCKKLRNVCATATRENTDDTSEFSKSLKVKVH